MMLFVVCGPYISLHYGVSPRHVATTPCIYRNPGLVKGKRVIELGAGVGAPGIAAALAGERAADGRDEPPLVPAADTPGSGFRAHEPQLSAASPALPGASEVVITDREPLSLECAALSARASGFVAFSPASPAGGLPETALGSVGAALPGLTCALLDWSLPVPSELLGRCVGMLLLHLSHSRLLEPWAAPEAGMGFCLTTAASLHEGLTSFWLQTCCTSISRSRCWPELSPSSLPVQRKEVLPLHAYCLPSTQTDTPATSATSKTSCRWVCKRATLPSFLDWQPRLSPHFHTGCVAGSSIQDDIDKH